MYCRVFACEFDGTGATNGELDPEVVAAFRAAHAQGWVTRVYPEAVWSRRPGSRWRCNCRWM